MVPLKDSETDPPNDHPWMGHQEEDYWEFGGEIKVPFFEFHTITNCIELFPFLFSSFGYIFISCD